MRRDRIADAIAAGLPRARRGDRATWSAAAGDACVAVVSDHGSGGAGDRVVHLNRCLASSRASSASGRGAERRRRAGCAALALRAVPFRLQGTLVRRAPAAAGRLEGGARFGGIDWTRTAAFSEELDYHPSVWINVRRPRAARASSRRPSTSGRATSWSTP